MPELRDINEDGAVNIADLITGLNNANNAAYTFILPGTGEQMEVDPDDPVQAAPLLRSYSPRLFGAPPQLTHQCDMRILSSDGTHPGPVGDFYLTKILQDAHIANFTIGRARFTGGISSLSSFLHELYFYAKAMKAYKVYNEKGETSSQYNGNLKDLEKQYIDAYKIRDTDDDYAIKDEDLKVGKILKDKVKSVIGGLTDDSVGYDTETMSSSISGLMESITNLLGDGTALIAALKTSMSVQRPFYTFEADWSSYINNVKSMINTAIIMLGLQKSCVRIGDDLYGVAVGSKITDDNDVWSNYRAITPSAEERGDVNAKDAFNGAGSKFVSFMIDPTAVSESYTNSISTSVLMSSIMSQGSSIGNEIAFITNSTVGTESDAVISLAKESKDAAEEVMKKLGKGQNGRFTAAITSSMAKSYIGDHTIYPDIYQSSSATSNMNFTIHLVSDSGDPYSYFINILVPMFYLLGMALPALSPNNASAYTYPPLIQCNVPGMWGTRLGMVNSLSFNKNPSGKDVSINGYPLAVDVTLSVTDLEHVLLTAPMNKLSVLLNNQTMFDYIAQCSGVDKFRPNGAMRTIAKLALTQSGLTNIFHNVTDALLNDWHSIRNRIISYDKQ